MNQHSPPFSFLVQTLFKCGVSDVNTMRFGGGGETGWRGRRRGRAWSTGHV